jgi:glycosyltransferase involved in cell wall biosynthesis
MLLKQGHRVTHLTRGARLSPAALMALRRLVREHSIDIVHTHGFKTDVMAVLALRTMGVPLITTTHGWCDSEGGLVRAYEVLGRRFLHAFDRVFALTVDQTVILTALGIAPHRVRLIPNAVDVGAFDDVNASRENRRSHFQAVFVGRLGREKGVLDAVRAIAWLPKDVSLSVVGEGPARAEAEALAREHGIESRVRFHGLQPDVRQYLEQASVLLLPSHSEGTPRVVMEAFAAGLPVVASDIPGVRVLVTNESTGLLSRVGDPRSVASAIQRFYDDPTLARRCALSARRLIAERFSAERLVGDLIREYRDVLSETKQSTPAYGASL